MRFSREVSQNQFFPIFLLFFFSSFAFEKAAQTAVGLLLFFKFLYSHHFGNSAAQSAVEKNVWRMHADGLIICIFRFYNAEYFVVFQVPLFPSLW